MASTTTWAIMLAESSPKIDLQIQHGQLGTVKRLCAGRRFEFTVRKPRLLPGAPATLVTAKVQDRCFTFFLRDVNREHPILLPRDGAAVTVGGDPRNYQQIQVEMQSQRLRSEQDVLNQEPEETFEHAAANTRNMVCETWLGLSRDIRLFLVEPSIRFSYVLKPRLHHRAVAIPEAEGQGIDYGLTIGRGCSCQETMVRRLDQGTLPILHAQFKDGDLEYQSTFFTTLEQTALTAKNLEGTHHLVAFGHSGGHMFTPEQKQEFEKLKTQQFARWDQTVMLLGRIEAINHATTPRYAFLMTPKPTNYKVKTQHDGATGLQRMASGRIFLAARLNGQPMPQTETAVLLQPGTKIVMEFALAHDPLPAEDQNRQRRFAQFDFDARLTECRAFWTAKLKTASSMRLPEARIDEMVQAGLLHLDLISHGQEPKGPVAACIGVYSPIGSESAPIIQFYDSMGWHDLARRSLQFFLERQRPDGFIQNFGGYMLETGPVLWTLSEHFRYTRDLVWLRRIKSHILSACQYLLDWRKRNLKPSLKDKGYGMIEGKVADPEDHYRQFMLNAYSCLGIQRSAEMFKALGDLSLSAQLERDARNWKQDIRKALSQAMDQSPVVPVGDGTWVRSAPPWAEMRGPAALYVDGQPCFTHGSVAGRDSLIGPLYLILANIVDGREPIGEDLLRMHQALFTLRNAAFSQPYYTRHDWAHLQRGEIKSYLKTYYNQMASLADRQTYSFWEHYHLVSSHKTHEEAWFLMQTRWMLWREVGEELHLLSAVPSAWLNDGQDIQLAKVASYFGPVSMKVQSRLSEGEICAQVRCDPRRAPDRVCLRLPHPQGLQAIECRGGKYDSRNQTVIVQMQNGCGQVTLKF